MLREVIRDLLSEWDFHEGLSLVVCVQYCFHQ